MNSTKLALQILVQAGLPVYIEGPPGSGKTSYCHALAGSLSWWCETIVGSHREPSDFGFPYFRTNENGVTVLAMVPPEFAYRLNQKINEMKGALLFVDEMPTSPPSIQAPMLKMFAERLVGEYALDPRVTMVAAGNPSELCAGYDLSATLANRMCHLAWRTDPKEFQMGMISDWPAPEIWKLPTEWKNEIKPMKALVAAYIRHQPQDLNKCPENSSEQSRAWPSERTWEYTALSMAACKASGVGEEVEALMIAGWIGDGTALKFLGWKRDQDLPNQEQIKNWLSNPSKFKLPKRGDKAMVVLSMIISAAVADLTPQRWIACWDILAYCAGNGAADIAVLVAESLASHRNENLSFPKAQTLAFVPILKAAGLMSDI